MSEAQASRYEKGLVDDEVSVQQQKQKQEGATNTALGTAGNYPPQDDSTSSGGYGSTTNVWSDKSQRGYPSQSNTYENSGTQREGDNEAGLIDQSATGGGPLSDELQDAKQGKDGEYDPNPSYE